MQSKVIKYTVAVLVVTILLFGAFSGGVIVGWAMPQRNQAPLTWLNPTQIGSTAGQPDAAATAPQVDTDTLFKPFWQTWKIVHDQYVDQPVNDLTLMQGAIRGMLDSLGDKHTSYMDPDQYNQSNSSLQGEYEGIGAWVDTTTDFVTITNPMPNSPALAAGLKPGDQIIAVDGKDMTGIVGSEVLRHILGPAGTKVELTIQRKGEAKTFNVTIERKKIVVPSAEGKMLDNQIAYIKLNTFGDKSTSELRRTLKDLLAQNPKGLVFDLRNNGGGYLNTAIEVVSEFVDSGVVMYEEYGDGTRRSMQALGNGMAIKIPLVVLVNEGTASASEITAGAIQDYGRGKLVGVKTYGKGSVQNWIALDGNQGAVRVTVARWLTPKARQINQVGLTPDVEVKITDADLSANRDPQLDKAVELLKAGQ
jgi:carboxyl-terminal processing protease